MAEPIRFFVDTNILIRHLRQKSGQSILDQIETAYGLAVVSDIVVFEMEIGAQKAGRSLDFSNFFPAMPTYALSQEILLQTAILQVNLIKQNQGIGLIDTMIAATAIYHQMPLFSLNTKHFQRVSGLNLLPMPE